MNRTHIMRKTWKQAILVGGVIALAVLGEGSLRWSTSAGEGVALQGTATRPPRAGTIRLGTYNIDGGMGLDGVRDLNRSAGNIADCDLVALNEIHGRTLFTSQDQAELLGRKVGLAWLFAPVERQWWHDAFGNALLTNLPVTRWQRLPCAADTASSHRNLLLLSVNIGNAPVNVLIAHVERGHDHESQLRAVLGLFLSLQAPAALLGDLNTTEVEPQIKQLLAATGVVDAIGSTIPNVGHHVDWILLRGMHASNAGMKPKGVSDHPFFWTDVAVD